MFFAGHKKDIIQAQPKDQNKSRDRKEPNRNPVYCQYGQGSRSQ